jgi:ATP-binding cassette subfamily B protein
MALAMFGALPLAVAMIAVSAARGPALAPGIMRAKINAANRLQEYLSGIRVIKAHTWAAPVSSGWSVFFAN